MKLIIWGDTHIDHATNGKLVNNLPQMVADIYNNLKYMVDFARGNHVDFALFAGDMYRNSKPLIQYKKLIHEILLELSDICPIYGIVGNHDINKHDIKNHALAELTSLHIPGINIYTEPTLVNLGEYDLYAIPWLVKDAPLLTDFDKPTVAIFHGTVDTATLQNGQEIGELTVGKEVVLPTNYFTDNFVVTGLSHIHATQVLSTSPFVGYTGASERLDWGEIDCTPGFLFTDIESTTHIPFNIRQRKNLQFRNGIMEPGIVIDNDTLYRVEVILDSYKQPYDRAAIIKLFQNTSCKIVERYPPSTRTNVSIPNPDKLTETDLVRLYFESINEPFTQELENLCQEILTSH